MKLVTDTNVVVSGLLWLGNPGRILQTAALGQITLYTSPVLIVELARIIGSPKLAPRVARSGLGLEDLLARYLDVAIVVEPTTVPRNIPTDPDDDHVLACALAAQADLIVSGDTDLLDLATYHGIPILSPAAAINIVSG